MRKAYTILKEGVERSSGHEVQVWVGSNCLVSRGLFFPIIFAGELFFRAALPPTLASFFGTNPIGTRNHMHGGLILGRMILGRLFEGLFPLDQFTHLMRRPYRLDIGGLEDLALGKGA